MLNARISVHKPLNSKELGGLSIQFLCPKGLSKTRIKIVKVFI